MESPENAAKVTSIFACAFFASFVGEFRCNKGDLSSASDGQLMLLDVFFHWFYCLLFFSNHSLLLLFLPLRYAQQTRLRGFRSLFTWGHRGLQYEEKLTERRCGEKKISCAAEVWQNNWLTLAQSAQKQMASGVLSTGDAWKIQKNGDYKIWDTWNISGTKPGFSLTNRPLDGHPT